MFYYDCTFRCYSITIGVRYRIRAPCNYVDNRRSCPIAIRPVAGRLERFRRRPKNSAGQYCVLFALRIHVRVTLRIDTNKGSFQRNSVTVQRQHNGLPSDPIRWFGVRLWSSPIRKYRRDVSIANRWLFGRNSLLWIVNDLTVSVPCTEVPSNRS